MSRFGKETAKIFIKNGWKVIITGRRGNRLEDLTKELGENCLPLCFDITDRVAVKKEIENIPPDFSKIDVLCNNAGIMALKDKATIDGFDIQMQTNHLSHFLLCKKLMPLLKKATQLRGEARVVNHSSIARFGVKALEAKYLEKNGGNLGTQGSAAHNFKQIGVIRIDIKEIKDDKIFELAIDAGADECLSFENFHEIHCGFEDIYSIKKKIETHVENFISTDIEWIPLNKVSSEGENKDDIKKLIELLDDDDDVQKVYSNFGEDD